MTGRLVEDHQRAQRLAQGLAALPELVMDPGTPYSNMVFCGLVENFSMDAEQVAAQLAKQGVLVGDISARRFRLVTHYWIDDRSVETTIAAFAEALKTGRML